MFNYCPSCASQKIRFEKNKRFFCPDCGFVFYQNVAAATGCLVSIPQTDGGQRLLFLVRGKEPMKGKLDLPGGFVDPGENVLEGLYRELKEEIGWVPHIDENRPLTKAFRFFASFPNVYPYKNIVYNTCDLFFSVPAPAGLSEKDFCLQQSEVAGIRLLRPQEIDFEEIAFDSMKKAIREYIGASP
ncbi:MAG: NUDIX domain-containing protein [Spirochaetes bacterium]|nr:NUDIX domain-containing protein [Spirochaetota bacterium]